MEVFIHLPQTKEGRDHLAQAVAKFHAQHALKMLQQLPCPTNQKLELLDTLVKDNKTLRKKDSL